MSAHVGLDAIIRVTRLGPSLLSAETFQRVVSITLYSPPPLLTSGHLWPQMLVRTQALGKVFPLCGYIQSPEQVKEAVTFLWGFTVRALGDGEETSSVTASHK